MVVPGRTWTRRLLVGLAALTLAAGVTGTTTATAANSSGTQDSIVLVAPQYDAAAVAASYGLAPDAVWRSALHGFSADLAPDQVTQLRADTRVQSVTVNNAWRLDSRIFWPGPDGFSSQVLGTAIPRIGADRSATADIDKRDDARVDVDVAVIDSGVQPDHPDLNVVGGVDCTGSGSYGDGTGHGTFAAGTIGAVDNKFGVVGVAPGARIWSVRFFDSEGVASDQTVLCAVDWVTAHANVIEVANMSFVNEWTNRGGTCDRPRGDAILAAVCAMTASGVTAVAAAGNDAADASGYQPAGFPTVITASGLADYDGRPGGKTKPTCHDWGADDSLATFSNFGAPVDIAAPSTCVSGTYWGSAYALWYGTSFASSYTAGAAALYKSTHRAATPDQVRTALLAAAEPGPIPGDPDPFPEPVLNASTF